MTLTEEQKNLIVQDFIDIFRNKFGEDWRHKLTSSLKPSPIHEIAKQRGAPISEVRKIRSQMMAVGRIFEMMQTMNEAWPNGNTQHSE